MTALNQMQKEIMATLRKNIVKPIITAEQGLGKDRPAATHEVINKNTGDVVCSGSGQDCADYLFEYKGNGIIMRPKSRY